jgi:hypothetical protein
MQKIVILLAALLLPVFCFSQAGFWKFYGQPNTSQFFSAVLPTTDGGFIFAGTNGATPDTGDDFWLVKTDSLGNQEWEAFYGGDENQRLSDADFTPDGGIILAGYSNQLAEDYDGFVVKLDSGFQVQWERKLAISDNNDVVTDIQPTPDGGFYATISVTNGTGRLVKLNASGEQEFLLGPPILNVEARETLLLPDGHFLYYGETLNRTWAYKVNESGDVLWAKEIRDEINNKSLNITKAAVAPLSGGIIMFGNTNTENLLTRLNYDGTVAWQHVTSSSVNAILEISQNKFFLNSLFGGRIVVKTSSGLSTESVSYLQFSSMGLAADAGITDSGKIVVAGGIDSHSNEYDASMVVMDFSFHEITGKIYGEQGPRHREDGVAFLQTPDRGFLLAGGRYFNNKRKDFYLVKTDSFGQKEWESNYGSGQDEYISSLAATHDHGYVAAGRTGKLNVAKFNASGELQWGKAFDTLALYQMAVVAIPDSSMLVLYNSPSDFSSGWAKTMKISPSGDSLWVKPMAGTTSSHRFQKTIFTKDEKLLAVGGQPGKRGWVVKTDLDGNVLYHLFLDGNTSWPYLTDVEETADGDYLLTGAADENDDGIASIFLAKINAAGAILWEKTLAVNQITSSGVHIAALNKFEFLISSRGLAGEVYFHKIDGDGHVLDLHEHEGMYDQSVSDILITHDNSVAVFGDAYNKNTDDLYLWKTGPEGAVRTEHTQPPGQLTLHPNPSNGVFHLTFESEFTGKLLTQVFDAKGQLLRSFLSEKTNPVFEQTFHLKDLPGGTYFVLLSAGNQRFAGKWLKNR